MRSRGHAGCVGCLWEKAEPPKCSGHVAGPSSCSERPDSDRFAKPLCAHESCEKPRFYNGWCEDHQPVSPEESKAAKGKAEKERDEAFAENAALKERIEGLLERAEKDTYQWIGNANRIAWERDEARANYQGMFDANCESIERAKNAEKERDEVLKRAEEAEAQLAQMNEPFEDGDPDFDIYRSDEYEFWSIEYRGMTSGPFRSWAEAHRYGEYVKAWQQVVKEKTAKEQAEAREADALAGQAVLLTALQDQACMCTSHRICARCKALTNCFGRVREIMAAVRIAPKLIDMLSQVPVDILWTRQCRHDLLDSEDAKLVLGACKTRLKVLSSAPGVNKEAP